MTTYIDDKGLHHQRTVVFAHGDYNTTAEDAAALAREVLRENMPDVIVDQTSTIPAIVIESDDAVKLGIAVAVATAGKKS